MRSRQGGSPATGTIQVMAHAGNVGMATTVSRGKANTPSSTEGAATCRGGCGYSSISGRMTFQ